ncbi:MULTISPECIES: DUF4287 domain-containing protein [unclassified Caulobacter]|uniref:DUF4287 domain-containing protein n=1 Tax=unclassified Caulobacter TaxID=2648921 RepID=UPI000D3A2981|nr:MULTISPECIES: DUF4287 domain-containing protein [unclassified Caulobacter]PTS90267.1 DUF4287 domain-containing protein [Caulobacter sp. HMWF009]PTT06475.1 DUF4287 domain-containing protein [Caulobacter sp. HMWF025]
MTTTPQGLTEQQQKWFASVRANLQRETGKTLEDWVELVKRECPETRPKARTDWLKATYGIGQNRAATIFGVAFPSEMGWDDADGLRAALWTDPDGTAILAAIEAAVTALPDVVTGQRKSFTAWSRKSQFAALKPARGGGAVLGLAVTPEADPRLLEPRNEGWSDRLKAKRVLASPADVDDGLRSLLKAAWERS